jgi:uncharacterized protein (DUF427 family)
VWDYPRRPRVESAHCSVRVVFRGLEIGLSDRALRVVEEGGPPTIYIPVEDVAVERLHPARGRTLCEWKGWASYFDVVAGVHRARRAAWAYRSPRSGYEELRDHVSFYPARVDACYLGDERVTPQPGRFYGGWITADIAGPFKGGSTWR